MSDFIERLERDENFRREAFPACRDRIFLAHAAVTALPAAAVAAMNEFNRASATGEIDYSRLLVERMDEVRASAAGLLGCDAGEVALLGPTSLGLSLVANGIRWREGDEIVAYLDDYPANVHPWTHLAARGVRTVFLRPGAPGEITPELVRDAMGPRTRLLALASCHFLSGCRLDIEAVAELARERGALFCLDAIQTAGAFPTPAGAVDFFSADSHKWLLGPMTAGVFKVSRERFEELEPSLLGAWNVKSPDFVAREEIEFEPGGRRYEPGVLNASGLLGMEASLELLAGVGIARVAARILEIKEALCDGLAAQGFEILGPRRGSAASGITTFTRRDRPADMAPLFRALEKKGVLASFRKSREGVPYIRFSPHFYNTHAEIDRTLRILRDVGA